MKDKSCTFSFFPPPLYGEAGRGTCKEGIARCVFVSQKPCAFPAGTFHLSLKSLINPQDQDLKTMRPKIENEEKLGEGIRLRVTELEKKLLLQRCNKEGYLTLSSFCRAKLVNNREIKKIEASEEFITSTKKLDYKLIKIGVNLNQVSKRLNIRLYSSQLSMISRSSSPLFAFLFRPSMFFINQLNLLAEK